MNWRITLLAVLLAMGSGGCRHVRNTFVLPAPQAAVAKPLPEPQIEIPPEIETPVPIVSIPLPEMPSNPAIEASQPKPVPPRRQTTQPAVGQTTPIEVAPSIPIVPPGPAPRLGEILTDDRRHQYEEDFKVSVARARAAVSRTAGRRLNATQRETVARIRVFLQQAEASRAKDLATALQLAHRADLLGQDLLKSLL